VCVDCWQPTIKSAAHIGEFGVISAANDGYVYALRVDNEALKLFRCQAESPGDEFLPIAQFSLTDYPYLKSIKHASKWYIVFYLIFFQNINCVM
jgi:hypothetical protein